MDAENSIISFMRKSKKDAEILIFVCNFTPVYRENYRIGVPYQAYYREILNTDSFNYWGSNKGNLGGIQSEKDPWHGKPFSLKLNVPPMATVIFKPDFKIPKE